MVEKPNIKVIGELGDTVEAAFNKLQKSLPYAVSHEAYLNFEQKNIPVGGGFVVAVAYTLKPGYADNSVETGPAAYRTPMERRHQNIRL